MLLSSVIAGIVVVGVALALMMAASLAVLLVWLDLDDLFVPTSVAAVPSEDAAQALRSGADVTPFDTELIVGATVIRIAAKPRSFSVSHSRHSLSSPQRVTPDFFFLQFQHTSRGILDR